MKRILLVLTAVLLCPFSAQGEGVLGYYRYPTLHGDTIVFAAEGDLWTVPTVGGLARRLTTHPGEETHPSVSPDGSTLAFSATYEGPMEVYTMPLAGGLPMRRTWEAESSTVNSWLPDGRLLYATSHFSTLPDYQLVVLDLEGGYDRVPLSQASEGIYNSQGDRLFFVRPGFHRNVTKRYTGGTARRIWRFDGEGSEAAVLTDDYVGESHTPMWALDRVYFITDRDGTMNLWSMDETGGSLSQHTRHSGWDVRDASLSDGRIVYQSGADLWIHHLGTDRGRQIPITLATDVDQWRDNWVEEPMDYLTSVHIHPEGESAVMTARGRVFVAPAKQGRLVRPSRKPGVRYRDAVFMPDGEHVLALSDESGELEFVEMPATGVGDQRALTADGAILRFEGVPSPDGRWVAYTDQNRDLWLLEASSGQQKVISTNREGAGGIAWAPDSAWVAFEQAASNSFNQIWIHDIGGGSLTALTSDRVNSWSPVWDPKGEWIYFLSDRELRSLVGSPWGTRQPEPYFDKPDKIYQVALREGLRSAFRQVDELFEPGEKDEAEQDPDDEKTVAVRIDLDGLQQRLHEVPVAAGNLNALDVNDSTLFWLARTSGPDPKWDLMALAVDNEKLEPTSVADDVQFYDLSRDGSKILVRKKDGLFIFDASASGPDDLSKHAVDLSSWTFPIDVREDWQQIYTDAWRLQRDHFYDPNLHGVDWKAVHDKYLPLVDRVTTRDELSELIGRVMGELSALHMSVRGGDHRRGPEEIKVASLGARLVRDSAAGGYRVEHIYRSDPDYPAEISPLARPDVAVSEGDVIIAINGIEVLSVDHIGYLLRNRAEEQLRLRVAGAGEAPRDVIVVPTESERSLRYRDWQYTRRQAVEELSDGQIGYVHLRAMGSANLTEWYRQFYPVFERQGLIIDVRHNDGGNIDSIILEKLLRRAWFYWKGRVEDPYWNMQYAFRGHMVVLCDQDTASDGEVFAEGFRRLDLGPVIGMRTWGGEIWLSSINRLSDSGIARAPMWGTYDDQGNWLIEQHGVDPDIVVDNLPHATFHGEDAQLQTAIDYLLDKIATDPRPVPEPPPYPDRSFDYPDP